MSQTALSRPDESEYAPFYSTYVSRITDHVEQCLLRQHDGLEALRALNDSEANRSYEPGKWTVKEVVGHISDAERVFAYRLLRIGRGDTTPLAGFEQTGYVANADFGRHSMGMLLDSFRATRASTLALMSELDPAAWARSGTASGFTVTARAIAFIIAGHFSHHASHLRDKYGLSGVTEP